MLKQYDICILMPVYNDWVAVDLLLKGIHNDLADKFCHIILVDDGSCEAPNLPSSDRGKHTVSILNLTRNIGHQKAIAIGLAYINDNINAAQMIVMDSDGEDRAQDLKALIKKSEESPGKIIFAKRIKRKESLVFRVSYQIYRIVFKLLVGKKISFGNFSLIPKSQLKRVAHISEIWNNYSAGVIYSRIPYEIVPIERGSRLAGSSKMNFVSLVLHGLGAISVHSNTVAVRVFILSSVLMGLSLLGILVALFIKYLTVLAIPGWVSNVILGLTTLVVQSSMISLFLIFVVLNHRTHRLFIPAIDYKAYVLNFETVSA